MSLPARFVCLPVCLVALLTASTMLWDTAVHSTSDEKHFFCNYGEKDRRAEVCALARLNRFASTAHAQNAVDMILKPLGLRPNFVLVPCAEIDNAAAVTYQQDGLRYILYNNDFMDSIDRGAISKWASVAILAHEIGHHLQGHTTLRSSDRPSAEDLRASRANELEADEFSGFVMFKLGRSLPEAQSAIKNLTDVRNEELSTHPQNERRLQSIARGFEIGRQLVEQPSASVYSYKITGWIDSLDGGSVKRTLVNFKGTDHKPKFPFPGTLYKLHLVVEQFTNGKYCARGEMRESPYMAFRVGETSSARGEPRPTFQGGSQVEGNQLAVYLNPSYRCN